MRGVIIGYMHTEAVDVEFEEIPCEYIYVAYISLNLSSRLEIMCVRVGHKV